MNNFKITIGSDHAGFAYREATKAMLMPKAISSATSALISDGALQPAAT